MHSKRQAWLMVAMVLGVLLPVNWVWPQVNTGSAWITVNVPANARVVINGNATRSTGMSRDFVSHGLIAGRAYKENDLHRNKRYELMPWATVAGAGEACVARTPLDEPILCVRTTPRDQITGRLFLPSASAQKTVRRFYTATADQSLPNPGKTFFEAKHEYYQRLFETCSAGREWFRHQARSSNLRLRLYGSSDSTPTANSAEEHPLSDWFATMTGGRAVTENLKLNPYVSSAGGRSRIISVDSIRGIKTRAISWSRLSPKEQPALDPLAACIPADQHAMFFPSAEQASVFAEHAAGDETVFLRLADPRTEHWRIRERYEQQLGISLSELVELLGPDQPRRIALTGSDPYVVMGTDVAILIESSEADALASRLAKHIANRVAGTSEIEVKTWNSPVIKASGVCSADRRICSYVAALPQAVVLTNSVYQLQRLSEVHNDDQPSLASLPEYRFFRDRYALGEPSETALIVISDAAIRRWGSPRWRIGQTRRLAAANALAEWQATWIRSGSP